jgi:hypothetical protein
MNKSILQEGAEDAETNPNAGFESFPSLLP